MPRRGPRSEPAPLNTRISNHNDGPSSGDSPRPATASDGRSRFSRRALAKPEQATTHTCPARRVPAFPGDSLKPCGSRSSARRPRSGASRRRGRGSLDADEPPRTLALASPRRVRMYAAKPQPIMGTTPRRAERSEGRTMNPRDRPLWYEGRGRYRRAAGPRWGRRLVWAHRAAAPRRRRNDAAVNSPGEWARRSPRYGPPEDRGNSGERRTGGAVAAWADRRRV